MFAPILQRAVDERVWPGAVVYAARGDETLAHEAVGTLGIESPFDEIITRETIYDLASLTKIYVLAAAFQTLRAHQIALDESLQCFFPAFDERITLRHLMGHSSGLQHHLQPLAPRPIDEWLPELGRAPLQSKPGERVFYNCANYFLLGRVLKVVDEAPLETIIRNRVLTPANLRATFAPTFPSIAPTERDERGNWLCGQVHDEAARSFRVQSGDCAGNAGLFSDAADVAAFAQLFWHDAEFFHQEDLRFVDETVLPENSGFRGLGFQIDAPHFMGDSPRETWGHLGFTGPSLTLHSRRKTVLVVLNNRVHPTRFGPNRMPFLREIAEKI